MFPTLTWWRNMWRTMSKIALEVSQNRMAHKNDTRDAAVIYKIIAKMVVGYCSTTKKIPGTHSVKYHFQLRMRQFMKGKSNQTITTQDLPELFGKAYMRV